MSETSMHIDAILLVTFSLAVVYLLSEDAYYQALIPRALGALMGAFSFVQAMWLLGFWIPGASGFPLPRIGFDATIAVLAIFRAANVFRHNAMVRRQEKLNRRGAHSPFG